jgi:hypothetical protein
MNYSSWLQKIRDDAQVTISGQCFLEAGFQVVTTGGSCTAWSKPLETGCCILVTDCDGLDHRLSEDNATWLVGIYGNDELDELEPVEAQSVEEVIERAHQLKDKYTQFVEQTL